MQPRFPLGISPRTFTYIAAHLNRLEYSGPVGLSCDDTKLSAGLDPVFDKDQDGFFILGGVGQPLRVADPENFTAEIKAGKIAKAAKVSTATRCVYNELYQPVHLVDSSLGHANPSARSPPGSPCGYGHF